MTAIMYCFKSFAAAVSTSYGGLAINIDVFDSVNNPTSVRSDPKVSKGSLTSRRPNGSYSGRGSTLGGRKTNRYSSKNSEDASGIVVLSEICVESQENIVQHRSNESQ
jgi:hypothetical protein